MTQDDFVDKVFRRIGGGKPQSELGIYRNAIQSIMPDALQAYAVQSIVQPWRAMLEFDYTLAITSGVALVAANTDLLIESIPICDNVVHANVTTKFKYKARVSDLEFAVSVTGMPFGFYTVSKIGVQIAHASAVITGNLTVRAVKVPTILTVPTQTERYLIDMGAILAMQKVVSEGASV